MADKQTVEAEIDKKLRVAYELARAATATEEGRKAIDFFYHVHLNSYPGFGYEFNQLLIKERLVRGIYELERLEYIPQMHGDWQKVIDDRITKLESELASLENQLGEKS